MDYSIHDAIEAGFQQDVPNPGEQDKLFLLVKKFCMSHLQLSMQMTTMERKSFSKLGQFDSTVYCLRVNIKIRAMKLLLVYID